MPSTASLVRCEYERPFVLNYETDRPVAVSVHDGSRRRTPGGVFLHLPRGRLSLDIHRLTFTVYQPKRKYQGKKRKAKPKPSPQAQNQPASFEPFDWSRRRDSVPPLLAQPGEATSVKITLIGRPGATHIESHTVLTTMEHTLTKVSLPKGVPAPPTTQPHIPRCLKPTACFLQQRTASPFSHFPSLNCSTCTRSGIEWDSMDENANLA